MRNNCLSFVGLFFVLSTFVVSCDNSTNDDGGAEYVELGLPSGIKWATCNIGATKPEEYGGYYAWGETEEKSDYDWDTYKWYNGTNKSLTKYCKDSDYGRVDNKTVLDPEDDVAHVKWGGSWRMPTSDEIKELKDNCTWQWTTLNGVKGYRVTGPNGNSIFLPAAGFRFGAGLNDIGGAATGRVRCTTAAATKRTSCSSTTISTAGTTATAALVAVSALFQSNLYKHALVACSPIY